MIFAWLVQIAWWALQVLVVIAVFYALAAPLIIRRRKRRPLAPWVAVVTAAQAWRADYYEDNLRPVRGEVAVRIARGDEFLTMGAVATDAEDFESVLSTLVASAEDRAAALNATLAELR